MSNVGYCVCLVYYDDQDKRRETYLCYLSAKEWQQTKRSTLATFAQQIIDKLNERAVKEDANNEKLEELSRCVKTLL